MSTTSTTKDLGWVVDKLLETVPGTWFALLASSDGLPMAHSQGSSEGGAVNAEHLSAVVSGLRALSTGAGTKFFEGEIAELVTCHYLNGFLFARQASDNTILAALAGPEVDTGLLIAQMDRLIDQLGEHFAAERRTAPDVAGRPS